MAEKNKNLSQDQTEQDALTTDREEDTSLEDLFDELDGILEAMDAEDVSLEDSFALYEKGMKKVRVLNDKLDQVEKKMLVIAADGSEEPLDE